MRESRVVTVLVNRSRADGCWIPSSGRKPGSAGSCVTAVILRDRKLAASAVRFLTLLAWIHPLPHFWVAFGSAIELPDNETYEPLEVVTEIVQHLGGPVDEPGMRRFLAQNFARFDCALLAVSVTWRRQLFATTDAKLGRAVYELRRPFAECAEVLDQQPEVEDDALAEGERAEGFADARIWTDQKPAANDVAGDATPALLGRLLLGQSHWRLEAFGAATLARVTTSVRSAPRRSGAVHWTTSGRLRGKHGGEGAEDR
jgi:hypothetical protein